MELKDKETSLNLLVSFNRKMQNFGKYRQYASIARKEGYIQIEEIFLETAENEYQHGKLFFRFLNEHLKGQKLQATQSYKIQIGNTMDNLKDSIETEREENSVLFPAFESIAKGEKLDDIGNIFKKVSLVDSAHETRFVKLLRNIEDQRVFKREEEVNWKCTNCGFIHKDNQAPETCPCCDHPKSHFKIFLENY